MSAPVAVAGTPSPPVPPPVTGAADVTDAALTAAPLLALALAGTAGDAPCCSRDCSRSFCVAPTLLKPVRVWT